MKKEKKGEKNAKKKQNIKKQRERQTNTKW